MARKNINTELDYHGKEHYIIVWQFQLSIENSKVSLSEKTAL